MALPVFKTLPTILEDMINFVIANSELSDVNKGSVIRSVLEAGSIELAEQYIQLQNVLDSFSFESAEGNDLDRRADDFDLERLPAAKAGGNIVITDTSISTKFLTLLDGAVVAPGAGTLTVDDTTGYPSSGTIILDRSIPSLRETVTYTGITPTTFTGVSALSFDHDDNTEVILSQQGSDETIPLGTIVFVPATSINPRIDFETTAEGTRFDGDVVTDDIPVASLKVGSDGNVTAGAITNFDTVPFATATVTNPLPMFSGRNLETDSELVSRIKGFISSLSRATKAAIEFGVIGVTDPVQGEVITASVLDRPGSPGIADLFVDNGAGLTATTAGVGDEVVEEDGEGGQKRARTQFFPGLEPTDLRLFKSTTNGDTTSVGVGTLTDSTASFVVDEFAGDVITDGAGNFFTILSNTATVFTLDTTDTPAAGRYAVFDARAGAPFVEGVDYELNPTTMEFELTVALVSGERLAAMASTVGGVDAYTRFTQLIREVQRTVSGDPTDLVNFPGIAAAGVQIFVSVPTVINQSFQLSLEANVGVSEDDLVTDTKNATLNYVNSLGVGDDIILSEIIAAVQAIEGVFDVKVLIPTDNVTVGESAIARTSLSIITVL